MKGLDKVLPEIPLIVRKKRRGRKTVQVSKLDLSLNLSKKEFTRIIKTLQQAENRSEALADMGIDAFNHEADYLEVIFILLKKIFCETSLHYIYSFLYQEPILSSSKDEDVKYVPTTVAQLWKEVVKCETTFKH